MLNICLHFLIIWHSCCVGDISTLTALFVYSVLKFEGKNKREYLYNYNHQILRSLSLFEVKPHSFPKVSEN